MKHIVTATFVVDDQDNNPQDVKKQFVLGYMAVTSQQDFETRTYQPVAVVATSIDGDIDVQTIVDGFTF